MNEMGGASQDQTNTAPEKSGPPPKIRSCVTCYTRKVRCDKESPCSNCRRAGVPCIFPSTDRPVRWARRYDRAGNGAASKEPDFTASDAATGPVLKRLKGLENLVKDLRGQLERANVASESSTGNSPHASSPVSSNHDSNASRDGGPASTESGNLSGKFGRMVIGDSSKSRYVSSGFWSKIYDELDGLENDSRGLIVEKSSDSEDEQLPVTSLTTDEADRTPWSRNAFMFKHNLNSKGPDIGKLHPLPSQIPYLLDKFQENINSIGGLVHLPTATKVLRNSIKDGLPASDEALAFSIYYAVVVSMEEDEVMSNFGVPKRELSLKYRQGMEHALAKADFLNNPDLTMVRALTIFISLARRHDSPRFIWMMTGIVIRMAQAIGLHRDGTHFDHLTPFEIEMRRRVWWVLYAMDIRASEDQGTEYTIIEGSFDTKFPLNVNDADITPETKEYPTSRESLTDMTYPLVWLEMSEATKQLMIKTSAGTLDAAEQEQMMNEIVQRLNNGYLRYMEDSGDVAYRIGVVIARIVMAKMSLLIHMPILFSEPDQRLTTDLRNRLFVAGIEIAEYNHELNEEPAGRRWRWIYQVYTHWWATIFILLEVSRRPWSPLVERAWLALHSPWLIPAQSKGDKTSQLWAPLRKLLTKARRHRDTELNRLRHDHQSASELLAHDEALPSPTSSGLVSGVVNIVEVYRERWRQISRFSSQSEVSQGQTTNQAFTEFTSAYSNATAPNLATIPSEASMFSQGFVTSQVGPPYTTLATGATDVQNVQNTTWQLPNAGNASAQIWSMESNFPTWLWPNEEMNTGGVTDIDLGLNDTSMDMDVDWYDWIKSTGGMG